MLIKTGEGAGVKGILTKIDNRQATVVSLFKGTYIVDTEHIEPVERR